MDLILWMKYQSTYGIYNDIHKTYRHDIDISGNVNIYLFWRIFHKCWCQYTL